MNKDAHNNETINEQPAFVSAWDKEEEPVIVIESTSFDLYSSNEDFGLAQSFEAEVKFKREEAAFLFGSSPDDLFFRANFGCLVKIPNTDGDKKKIRERLYRSRFGTFIDGSDSFSINKEHGIPVCLDALSMIPLSQDDDVCSEDEEHFSLSSCDIDEEEDPIEKITRQEILTDEIQEAVDREIRIRGGHLYVRFRPENKKVYAFDFVMLRNRFFVVVYADFSGMGFADEDMFDDDPPVWYVDEGEHTQMSPVFQAMKCRDLFRLKFKDVSIDSIVVLPKECSLLNDDDMQECWHNECHTEVVRTRKVKDSSLDTLRDYIASLPKDNDEPPLLDVDDVNDISSRFMMDIKNWM